MTGQGFVKTTMSELALEPKSDLGLELDDLVLRTYFLLIPLLESLLDTSWQPSAYTPVLKPSLQRTRINSNPVRVKQVGCKLVKG
jgi:hypothetical protein